MDQAQKSEESHEEAADECSNEAEYESDALIDPVGFCLDPDPNLVNYESHPQLVEEIIDIQIEKRAGQKIGLHLLDNALVAHVGLKTVCQDKIQVGDLLRTVNGTPVRSNFDCVRELKVDPVSGKFTITVSRIQVVHKKPGFTYQHIFINWPDSINKRLGLNLSQINDMIIVTSLAENSLCAERFEVYDRLLTVNHSYVFHKDQAKEKIIDSTGKFICLIERPSSDEAKEQLSIMHKTSFTVPIAEDANEYAETEVQRRKLFSEPSLKPVLKTTESNFTKQMRVQFESEPKTHIICSDVHPNKRLRPVRYRASIADSTSTCPINS